MNTFVPRPVRLLALLALLTAALTPQAAETVIKSPNDHRSYASFRLANGLKAVVISDPRTDKAAAALAVAVGSGLDPADRPGLAHFLEHMLFLGTRKYPQAGGYQAFITAHGGSHNAYTAYEQTNYFFDVDADSLEPALDRFAQFFIEPLFSEQYVAREKNAVESEYRAKIKDDGRRIYQVLKSVVNPAHPFSRFAVGSLDTLSDRKGDTLRQSLINFYARHYSAGLMTLVVLGREPLDVLRKWASDKFSAVPNTGAQRLEVTQPLFTPGSLPMRVNIVPLRDQRVLKLTWAIEPLLAHYRSKPADYVANLLGHEGSGSLLAALKSRGWADALGAGPEFSARDSATFGVSIALTREGLAHTEEVAAMVFRYLRLLRSHGIEQWRFDEQARMLELGFRFQESAEPIDYVSSLADQLQHFPARDVIREPYLMVDYDPALIRSLLARLTPEQTLMTVIAKRQAADRHEPWYDTPYSVTPIASATLAQWHAHSGEGAMALALPERNPFLPEQIALKPSAGPTARPHLLEQVPGLQLWHQQDADFGTPRADFYFSVRSPLANDSARHAVLTELYVALVNDQLNQFSYPASLAGLNYRLYKHIRGVSVRISGFDDKQSVLLSRLVSTLREPVIAPERFKVLKERRLRQLRNARGDRPYTQALSEVGELLMQPHWNEEQRLAALKPLGIDDLRNFIPQLLSKIHIVALSHGNVTAADARELAAVLKRGLLNRAQALAVPPGRVVKLEPGDRYSRELHIDHPDAAVAVYYQGARADDASRARFALLAQVLSAPFYQSLRTEQQLGYIVFSTDMPLLGVPGVAFLVQSPNTPAGLVEQHIERFVADFAQTVAAMSDAEFERNRQAVLSRVLEADKRLEERSDRYWEEIDLGEYRFDSRRRLADALRALSPQGFKAFYSDSLLGGQSRQLVVRAPGKQHAASPGQTPARRHETRIVNPQAFAHSKGRFALRRHEATVDEG